MRDARDAEDALLLERRDHATLLAAYREIVDDRCRIAVRTDAWHDVAQNVMLRLLAELARGRRYTVPYRVVVHKVIDWTIKAHFQGIKVRDESSLPDDFEIADETNPYRPLEDTQALTALFADLPEGCRLVLELRYRDGCEIDEIATRLAIKRNAVDQALHRGHAKLRECIRAR